MDNPLTWTPEYLISIRGHLSIWCSACQCLRQADPLALCIAGRGRQRFAEMRFRCTTCEALGRPTETGPLVNWWDGGYVSFDYSRAAKTKMARPPLG